MRSTSVTEREHLDGRGAADGGARPHGATAPVRSRPSAASRLVRVLVPALLTYGTYLVLQVLQLLWLRQIAPRFFWNGDAQAQFGPMAWWMGTNLRDGRPPLMDPEQGQAGNLVADMQYGALDPLHWGLQALAARADDLVAMSWIFGGSCVVLLGTGLIALLRSHGVGNVVAVAAALGTASSGFFLWYGSRWWPLLWSVGWLLWFWWGLTARRVASAGVLGLATWALLASGNPYVLVFALALVFAVMADLVRGSGSPRVLLTGPVLVRLTALLGGLAVALPTLLSMVELSGVMRRQGADERIGNTGFGVTNLADVLLGSPTLLGQTNSWSGNIALVPAMYTFVVAGAALALVDWRRAWRAPGVLPAAVVFGLSVAATQLPTVALVFRYPMRYLVVVQVSLVVLALVAVTAAPRLTRRRVLLAAAVVGAQGMIALFRAPVFVKWHALSAAVALLALAALLLLLRGRASRARGAGAARPVAALTALSAVVLVAGGASGLLLSARFMVVLDDRLDALAGIAPDGVGVFRELNDWGDGMSPTVAGHRAQSLVVDGSATAIVYDFGSDGGWSRGVLRGNGNLISGFSPGYGAIAVGHGGLGRHWCHNYTGRTCSPPQVLLSSPEGLGTTWLDLLAQDTVLLDRKAPQRLREHFSARWDEVRDTGHFTEYRRRDDLPGRVAHASGVEVGQEAGGSTLAYAGEPMDTYTVTTGADGGSLVLRVPFWPGLEATLDGRPLPVGSVAGAVVRLDLPADVRAGTVELSYRPVGERILVPAFTAGGALIAASLVAGLLFDGRRRPRPRG